MVATTHNARITGPVPYATPDGKNRTIPVGPCLVEQMDERLVDIIWGRNGERSAALPLEQVEAEKESGRLVLLD